MGADSVPQNGADATFESAPAAAEDPPIECVVLTRGCTKHSIARWSGARRGRIRRLLA
jgi:hypothetical protein